MRWRAMKLLALSELIEPCQVSAGEFPDISAFIATNIEHPGKFEPNLAIFYIHGSPSLPEHKANCIKFLH